MTILITVIVTGLVLGFFWHDDRRVLVAEIADDRRDMERAERTAEMWRQQAAYYRRAAGVTRVVSTPEAVANALAMHECGGRG